MLERIIVGTEDVAKLQLREEQLDVLKEWVKTADVEMRREVCTENRNIVVPVIREEVVIEIKVNDPNAPDMRSMYTETMRIPVREERVEVVKHPVVLEEVIAYKQRFVDVESVVETLKREELRVETKGPVKII